MRYVFVLSVILMIGSVCAIIGISIYTLTIYPDRLPDPGKDFLRDNEVNKLINTGNRIVNEPFVISAHRNDAGPFMNNLIGQAEGSGGYVYDSNYHQDTYKPSYYNRLVLMVPENFVEDMQHLRYGEIGYININYRDWILNRDSIVSIPDVSNDLVQITVIMKYKDFVNETIHTIALIMVFVFLGSLGVAFALIMVFIFLGSLGVAFVLGCFFQ